MRVLAQLRLALTLAWLRLRLTLVRPAPLLAWRRPAFRLLIVQLAWPRPPRAQRGRAHAMPLNPSWRQSSRLSFRA